MVYCGEKRPKGRRKQRGLDTLDQDQSYDRKKWRNRSRLDDPATEREKSSRRRLSF